MLCYCVFVLVCAFVPTTRSRLTRLLSIPCHPARCGYPVVKSPIPEIGMLYATNRIHPGAFKVQNETNKASMRHTGPCQQQGI
ncbi:uncharacterized protein EURHEDRAFT_417485 [Aspergillus ruber CBS 135680]|uniref:Secreted protein n=1 Tax=Aspergillus ruber (strain CBS 135680) TaxID=1388766 RepID=A0A017S0E1_ASPRC|nr:uncharacterized protein EURHEDRAFT_417485 [Aspergillus ruber CBS 135680]EYE90422.1 hypothetical protein EURHEDRAFT_417485 [Aspergillus ruber CBS 135680]